VQVVPAVVVVVAPRRAHAEAVVVHTHLGGDVDETGSSVVAKQVVARVVVGGVDVRIPVAVEVAPGGLEGVAEDANPRVGDVLEPAPGVA
jgi:hypothetical protein